jgi:hypothetical protein
MKARMRQRDSLDLCRKPEEAPLSMVEESHLTVVIVSSHLSRRSDLTPARSLRPQVIWWRKQGPAIRKAAQPLGDIVLRLERLQFLVSEFVGSCRDIWRPGDNSNRLELAATGWKAP